ncbi:MAG TPA: hypothetical protein VNC78_00050 [Actinomycetota bacterium]|nr:hypothetical protein [Actinomycetota bacterium]
MVRRLVERAAGPAAGASAVLFAGLSALRGKRFFHPQGVAFSGHVAFRRSGFDLSFDGIRPAIARISRGAGFPEPLPDVFGLAVKIPDIGQDLLLVTSGEDAATRHMLIATTGACSRPYSSVLPYELDGKLIVFGARPDVSLKGVPDQLGDMASLARGGSLRFDLTVGGAGTSETVVFASLTLEEELDEDVSFNPWNTVPGLKPAGALNRLRRETYESSQAARPDGGPR